MIKPKFEPTILVIEDDFALRRFLRTSLHRQGFLVTDTATGIQGINNAKVYQPDLVILDLGLPDIEGIEVVRAIRAFTTTPIIILSARTTDQCKIEVLDAKADDYLTKPFSLDELFARIRVLLRHLDKFGGLNQTKVFVIDNMIKRVVSIDDHEIHLTPIQYRLLTVMIRYTGKVLTHQHLLKEVWGGRQRKKQSLSANLYESVTAKTGT